jgi:hypothetical protein
MVYLMKRASAFYSKTILKEKFPERTLEDLNTFIHFMKTRLFSLKRSSLNIEVNSFCNFVMI